MADYSQRDSRFFFAMSGGGSDMPTSESERGTRTPARRPSRHRFLLATDGSANAARAAEFVANYAIELDAEVTVVAVATQHGPTTFTMAWESEPHEVAVPDVEASNWAHPTADQLRAQGIEASEIILTGHPSDAIIAEVEAGGIDAVVIGRHGTTPGLGAHPGSVAEELAGKCPCAVIVVP